MQIFKLFVLFLVLTCSAKAQSDSAAVKSGSVKYFQSEEIEKLVELRKSINQKKCPNLLKGYRVQIFSCSGIDCLEKIDAAYLKFTRAYPTISAAKSWEAPSHKLRIGNCRNRFAAEEIKKLIQTEYASIFIVPDFIDSPFKVECGK
jgi:hypothetical protein